MTEVIAVLGVGPGLGLSIAHRFGREGFTPALVSRSDARHGRYRALLADAGIKAHSYTADVTDETQLRDVLARISADVGEIGAVYFGPADAGLAPTPLPDADAAALRTPFESIVLPAANVARLVLPRMTERGRGTLLYAGGVSGKYPMPRLGTLAPTSAALRMYVLTLSEALRDKGIFVGALTIGGLIERGDIHRMITEQGVSIGTLDPDAIADAAWTLAAERSRAEAEFVAPGLALSGPDR